MRLIGIDIEAGQLTFTMQIKDKHKAIEFAKKRLGDVNVCITDIEDFMGDWDEL